MRKYFNLFNAEFISPTLALAKTAEWRHPVRMTKRIIRHFHNDSLYRNSIYLMLSTFVMAFFGFFFWMINARLYKVEDVGLATTLISIMTLIASFSNLGLNIGIIRFLPQSDHKNVLINTTFIVSTAISFLMSVVFIYGLPVFSPKLIFIQSNIFYIFTFILFVIILANNTAIEAFFVAYRSSKYIFYKNSFTSILKLFLTAFLLFFGSYGIFVAVGLANVIGFLLSLFILIRKYSYRFLFQNNLINFNQIMSYSFKNYIAGIISSMPSMLLPLLITNKIGSKEAAYFYMSSMIANIIFIIPSAINQALFAESSYKQDNLRNIVIKAIKANIIFLVPLITFINFFGDNILNTFGKQYSTDAFSLLQVLSLSGILISINGIFGAIFRIYNRINFMILTAIINLFVVLVFIHFSSNLKLLGVGYAWIFGQALVMFFYFLFYRKIIHQDK